MILNDKVLLKYFKFDIQGKNISGYISAENWEEALTILERINFEPLVRIPVTDTLEKIDEFFLNKIPIDDIYASR